MPKIAPYGAWRSPLKPHHVTAGQIGLSSAQQNGRRTYWCESRPSEAGRTTLMRCDTDGSVAELTPAPFYVRTRIQEYGGRPYTAEGDMVVAVSFADQRLWVIGDGGPVRPLTPEAGSDLRYGDLELDVPRRRVLAVREDHRGSGEPVTTVVGIPLEGEPHEGSVLVEGHDFFGYPRLSRGGDRMAWISWDHPNMPWNGTTLRLADLDATGRPETARLVAGGPEEAVVQPEWAADDSLLFISDRDGFWNLWRWSEGRTEAVLRMNAEFAGPLWQLGARWYGVIDDRTLACAYRESGTWRLGLVDLGSRSLRALDLPFSEIGSVSGDEGWIACIGGASSGPTSLIRVNSSTASIEILRTSGKSPIEPGWISTPQPFSFPTAGGGTAFAYYYPPTNPKFGAPEGTTPPLIVRSHGGPTGCASPSLKLVYQFWTTRGFAIVDVDYRGSTGYGRTFRQALEGQWGVADVEDCVAAAHYLVSNGKADPKRLVIAGSSAGGYTTLAALTFTDVFSAGASYYGIGDLEALARDTHKFESRYLDRLVGPYPDRADIYRERSPLHHTDRLSCPVIFFQGKDDKVVPPNQAEAMVDALRSKGIPVAYLAFDGEGHGFRKAETIERCLAAEYSFYCRVLAITAEEELLTIEIANLAD